jgi:hypothetical protein
MTITPTTVDSRYINAEGMVDFDAMMADLVERIKRENSARTRPTRWAAAGNCRL